jgi:hypothetical protein
LFRWCFFCCRKVADYAAFYPGGFTFSYQGGTYLKNKIIKRPKKERKHIDYGRILFMGFLCVTMMAGSSMQAFAATTVWEKANEIMKDVYNQILLISTIAAVVTAAVALLLMNFSKSGRTVDEARSWLKRIIITWAILNGLGFIMAYVTPFFTDGRWNG